MAQARRPSLSLVHTGLLIAVVLLPDFLGAVPVAQHKEEASALSSDAVSVEQKLVRNRRNLGFMTLPQFQRVPDFWAWYKIFTETHNQEGIYKNCADSDDPECIAESTSKPKASMVMPAPIKAAPVHMCNPYMDPYCMFPLLTKGGVPEPAPAPAKVPAPIFSPMLPMPMKTPTGFYYYAPVLEPFLTHEQRVELMRICKPEDVECLQYHLRAAYGYRPMAGPAPSYSALNCNPKDPYCKPMLVQKAPTGFYHALYPSCDPAVDPLCASVAGPAPLSADESPQEQHCNPLFDGGCNPLTATKLSGHTKPVLEPAPQLPEHQVRYRLGVPGKTRDGHDCYVHYDKDCVAVDGGPKAKAAVRAPATPYCHPFDPSCGKFSSPAAVAAVAAPAPVKAAAAGQGDIILPHPDCDPEVDYNCRLRRVKPVPAVAAADEPASADEPTSAEEPAAAAPAAVNTRSHAAPTFEQFLSGYRSYQYQHK
ncbi:hypothetical protein NHX12_005009 [Muraenolepis orangiensis]|uniref:Actinodin2 n=1 Tax=Muraenolepis orangiensis TaxID=630683 RepID=A0A9Q0IG29_9TELE|nr:hypothetical protein NHX12_005009 [Muraenolepis orangiensis]